MQCILVSKDSRCPDHYKEEREEVGVDKTGGLKQLTMVSQVSIKKMMMKMMKMMMMMMTLMMMLMMLRMMM